MREDFLHYIWRLQRFDHRDLSTTDGIPIRILEPGTYNRNAGPDFLNARVRIGDTLWAGNVEMHLSSSEWRRHRHQEDPAYENVILHVVLNEDEPVHHAGGERIPCLNLRHRLPVGIARRYLRLLNNEKWVPCQNLLYQVPEVTRALWLDRLLVERLEERTATMAERLEKNQYDWEATFYQLVAGGFGLHVNVEPFLRVAESLPLNVLLRHKHSLLQVEALLFGQAGWLADDIAFNDIYPSKLQREYRFLRTKFRLTPISATSWKFLRMRPANFPTIRMAQFAMLIYRTGHLFGKMLAARNLREIENAFVLELSNYWQDHYRFDKAGKRQPKAFGTGSIHLLVVNVIAPFIFLYGQRRGETAFQEQALALLESIPAENNRIIREWRKLGFRPENASQTQALLQLKQRYCDPRKCLDCAIGAHILSNQGDNVEEEEAVLYLPTWALSPVAAARLRGA